MQHFLQTQLKEEKERKEMGEDNTNQEIFYNQNYQKFILIYIKLYKKE